MIAHVQSSFDVACGDNFRSGRAQSRLEIERDKKLVLDNENKSPGKWRGLHHDPERATRRGLLAQEGKVMKARAAQLRDTGDRT